MFSSAHGVSWKSYIRRYLTKNTAESAGPQNEGGDQEEYEEEEEMVEGMEDEDEAAGALQPQAEDLMQGFGSLWGDPLLLRGDLDGTEANGDSRDEDSDGRYINGDNNEDSDANGDEDDGVVTVDYDDNVVEYSEGDGAAAYANVVLNDGDSDNKKEDEEEDNDDDDDDDQDEEYRPRSGGGATRKKRFSDDLAETCLMRCRLCGQETIPKSFHKHLEMRHQMNKAEYGPLTYVRKTFHRCHVCGAVMNFTRDSIGGHCRKVSRVFHCESKQIQGNLFKTYFLAV